MIHNPSFKALPSNPSVVGYQAYPLQAGYNCYTATFKGVGEKKLKLQDLKIEGSMGYMTETISLITLEGRDAGVSYTWCAPEVTMLDHFCWYDFEKMEEVDLEITDGMGLYVFSDTGDVTIVASGEVVLGAPEITLQAGYNLTGNFLPVDFDLQQITIEGSMGYMTETISLITLEGRDAGVSYTWCAPEVTMLDHFCWYDFDQMKEVEYEVKAGSGLYVFSDTGDVTLKFPQVLPAK
ncbi:MAG: hypothetical protein MJ249_14190 [Kiritimatiellae bacterium]|nr:hypothetical protein [Kiritimatiellia bacterium]